MADRLGPAAHRLWQLAAGKTERLLRLVRPVEEFAEAFEFEGEVETVEPLYFVLRRFLDQLCLRLETAHRVAAKLELSLSLENKTDHRRKFTIPSPTNESDVLFRILCTYLEGLQLSQRLAGVRLQIEPVRPESRQERLFDNPLRDSNKFGETLARIIALVGPENAGVVEMADTHRPDSYRLIPPKFHRLQEESSGKAENFSNGIPLRRFRPSFPARVHVAQGRPVQIFSEKAHGDVIGALGPYRLSGGWWEGDAWGTEEWDVEVSGEGIFRISHSNGRWLIEGCYESAIH